VLAVPRIRRVRPLGDFSGATAIEDFVFDAGIHIQGALFAPDPHSVFDGLVRDLFVALADNHVDGRLAADELG
jgi:hypothetical protein